MKKVPSHQFGYSPHLDANNNQNRSEKEKKAATPVHAWPPGHQANS